MLSEQRKGELSGLTGATLWGLFPVLTVLSVSQVPPLFTAAISTALSALFFAAVITWKREWVRIPSSAVWRDIPMTTFLIGIVFYGFTFVGYTLTSAGNGAIISQMEIFFTFLIVTLFLKHEHIVFEHVLGSVLMIIGALVILVPEHEGGWNIGDLIILVSFLFTPLGNFYAQRARKSVSAEMIMFIRSSLGAVFFFAAARLVEAPPQLHTVADSFWFILLNGIILLGLAKIFWVEAIHRIPIGKAIALNTIQVPLTLVFAYLLLGQNATPQQLIGILPMIGGVLLLTRK